MRTMRKPRLAGLLLAGALVVPAVFTPGPAGATSTGTAAVLGGVTGAGLTVWSSNRRHHHHHHGSKPSSPAPAATPASVSTPPAKG
jgi:hypothetical protein